MLSQSKFTRTASGYGGEFIVIYERCKNVHVSLFVESRLRVNLSTALWTTS